MSESLYEKRQRLEKSEVQGLVALGALVVICLFHNLGGVPLLGKDEPRYAEVAREMYVSGDWVTPRLEGHAWFEKPALAYWLMAAGFTLFGVTEFAARWGSALIASLGVAVVYLAARHAGGPRRAILSASVLATSGLWFSFARGASFDMPLAGTMAAAIGSVYAYDVARTTRSRLAWAASVGAWTGASMLAKGLAGPVLLALIVGAYFLVGQMWRRMRIADLGVALLGLSLVALTWYWPVYARNGWEFIDEFFVNHHFKRYLTNKYHHPQPVYFYVLIVLAGLMPWTFFLIGGIRGWITQLTWRPRTDSERLTCLAALSVLAPLAFFSFSTSKLPGYILPVFPGLALLAGQAIEACEAERRGRWAYPATALALVGLGFGLAFYGIRSLEAPVWEVALLGALPFGAALSVVVAWMRKRLDLAVWSVAAGSAVLVVLIATFLFGEVGQRESLADLSGTANVALREDEQVLLFGVVEYSPVFYTRGRMVVDENGEVLIANSADELARVARSASTRSLLCITDETRATQLGSDPRFLLERLGTQRNRILIRVTASGK